MLNNPFLSEHDFFQAFDEHSDALFRHCYLRIMDREKSKVLMCETFKRLWTFIINEHGIDSMKMFLYRTADVLIREQQAEERAAEKEGAEESTLFSVLRQVPPQERRTVILHFVDGFSTEEISKIIGGTAEGHATIVETAQKLITSILSSFSHAL